MSDIPTAVRDEVEDRSGGFCEAGIRPVCTYTADHMHHIVLRSRGGDHTASNLAHLCHPCHTWVHANPNAATRRGLMSPRQPEGATP